MASHQNSSERLHQTAGTEDVHELLAVVEALRAENAELRLQVLHLTSTAGSSERMHGGLLMKSDAGAETLCMKSFSSLSEAASQNAVNANATVRQKKNNIDLVMGKSAYHAPHVSSFRNLFNRSDVLQFEEDSPMFRLKMDELEESVDELREFAQQLVDSCRRYCKHGNAAVDAGREFSGFLTSLRSEAWTQRFGRVATLLAAFGDTFEEIESYREVLLSSLEETFCAPMEEFVRLEVKRVRHMKQDVQKASAELEASLVKYLRQRHGVGIVNGSIAGQESQEKWDAQLSVLRQSFELTRYDMVVELNSQKTNRKFQLCQRVCTALYAHLGYFQECHGVIAAVEPALDQLNTELAFARKEFSSKGMLYNLKRKLLLREVKRSSPALALLLPKRKRGSFQSDVVTAPHSSFSPASLIPTLGLDIGRRPSLEGNSPYHNNAGTSRTRRPSADALTVLSRIWSAPPADVLSSHPQNSNESNGDGLFQEEEPTTEVNLPEALTMSERRPPLFGQVGEIEGLRMSQFLGSRGMSDDFACEGDKSPINEAKAFDPFEHVRARSSSAEPNEGGKIAQANSNAGEIITTAVSPPNGGNTGVFLPENVEYDAKPARKRSSSSLSIYYESSKSGNKTSIRLQGYLWKQSNNMARDWHRRWFMIENGHLWYMQTDAGSNKPLIGAGIVSGNMTAASRDPVMHSRLVQAVEKKLVCSLLISTVKEMKGAAELKYCWQVISPGKRIYVLQAESLEAYDMWVAALRSEIEISLSQVQTSGAHSSSQAAGSFVLSPATGINKDFGEDIDFGDGRNDSTIVLTERQQAALKEINRFCADCGRSGPDWASVNNGVMLCIDCCGVHRSLGTHVSKVRSLRLDRWAPYAVQLLTEIGNNRFNAIYERTLGESIAIVKLTSEASRAERVVFITAKYLDRQFVGSAISKEQASALLIVSAGEGKIVGMVEALAAGADVDARTDDVYLLSALHCACRGGHALAVELLCQMNARVDIVDALGKTPSDYIDNDNLAVIDTLYTNVENELNSYDADIAL